MFTAFLNFLPSRGRLEKRHSHSAQNFRGHLFDIFKLFKNWYQVSRFFIFQTQQMCFWAWGRFGMSKNLPICFTNLQMFHKLSLILHRS